MHPDRLGGDWLIRSKGSMQTLVGSKARVLRPNVDCERIGDRRYRFK